MFSKKKSQKKSPANEMMDEARDSKTADIRLRLSKLKEKDAKNLVNTPDENGETVLHIAAGLGNLALVKLLLEYGANPNAIGIFNETPLHRAAAKKNNAEIVKTLIINGADYKLYRTDSQQPIHVAASNDAIDVIKALLEIDPEQKNWTAKEGRTPLFYANDGEATKLLGQNNFTNTGGY